MLVVSPTQMGVEIAYRIRTPELLDAKILH